MSDGGYGDGYDAGLSDGANIWKAKALDFETKLDVAVSTLEKVKVDRSAAMKALAAQCDETKKLSEQVALLRDALSEASKACVEDWPLLRETLAATEPKT